ncbi:MAG: hypothetical protein ABIS38_04675 [Sphingomicrobium sp.]
MAATGCKRGRLGTRKLVAHPSIAIGKRAGKIGFPLQSRTQLRQLYRRLGYWKTRGIDKFVNFPSRETLFRWR